MEADLVSLRLSAQRALLGAIHPEVRLISVKFEGRVIVFTAILAEPASDQAIDDLSCAAAEIIADFSWDYTIREETIVTNDPLPHDEKFAEWRVFQRAEA